MSVEVSKDMVVVNLPISEIYCDHDFNSRGKVVPGDVIDLVRSIDQIGLQTPIIVQPYDKITGKKWRIVSGHRRYMAHRVSEKGFTSIQAIIKEDLNENQARFLNLEENLKRKDLNRVQEAHAIAHLLDAGYTHNEIAKELSVPIPWVALRAHILEFPPEIQTEIALGSLTDDQIRQLRKVKSHAQQIESVRKIKVAKEGGEAVSKIRITPKRPSNPLKAKRREPTEIFKFMETIREVIGNGFHTRCLAWCAGTISDFELYRDLRDEAKKKGITWEIPKSVLESLRS